MDAAIELATWLLAALIRLLHALHGEFLLFAAFWLAIGVIDELLVDAVWLALLVAGRARSRRLPPGFAARPLSGRIAVFIPAWQEAAVIGTTLRHALSVWPQPELCLYVGCYGNDPGTRAAVRAGAAGDPRVRLVVARPLGPTTKGDCLNGLYRALCADEAAGGWQARALAFHDAEDMVHPAELAVFDAALDQADFVQLPVRAEPVRGSRWVAGHYVDEFAEAHGKTMVVRDALGVALPAAGVGFALRRALLGEPGVVPVAGPFAADCLTEDYELGLALGRAGRRARYLRLRDERGGLVATRCCFPDRLEAAVRQKARWVQGIACHGWDRVGWFGGPANRWMILRDRRALLVALVLASAYLALVSAAPLIATARARWLAVRDAFAALPGLTALCLAGLTVRLLFRFAFTAREYGLREGLRAILRIPVGNVIAILATRRALWNYVRSLLASPTAWDKTEHSHHPARGNE